MDLMRHHSRRPSILVKVSFLVDVMCPRCNYLVALAITHICKREKREGGKQKCQSRKGTDFSLLSESNEGLLHCKGISLKRRWDHMLQMHRAPFSICKCEFELLSTQMQKLHQWSEFNDSPVLKCVDNGHRECTQQQSEAWNLHHRTTLSTETAQPEGRTATPFGWRMYDAMTSDRQEGTAAPRCRSSMWQLAWTLQSSVFISHGGRGRLRSRGQPEQASASQLMPCERVCREAHSPE